MTDITPKEAQALLEFRTKLSDLSLDEEKNCDAYLIRWLRARDLNQKKSEELLRAHLKWREDYNVADIFDWKAPEKYKSMVPMELCGYDRIGHPIYIIPYMCTDVEELLSDKDEYMRYSIQYIERFALDAKKFSTPEHRINQCVLIYDMAQASFRPFLNKRYMDFVKESSEFFNDNYPEVMYRSYFLYCPKLVTAIFPLFKPFVPKKTLEKMRIYGSKPESWLSDLLEHIPPDQLPDRFGGTNTEFYKNFFPHLKNLNSSKCEDEMMIEASVPAGEKLSLDYKVEVPNCVLKWNFKSVNHDIGFSVHFEGKELINHGRVESHRKNQEGLITCEKEGEYTLVFENTYSKMRSKTIFYSVEIESPAG